jgi:hypothetical protein
MQASELIEMIQHAIDLRGDLTVWVDCGTESSVFSDISDVIYRETGHPDFNGGTLVLKLED